MKKLYCLVLVMAYLVPVSAQQDDKSEDLPQQTNNIGFGIGMAHLINESVWAPGLHLHYSKALDAKQRFSVGCGMEFLFGDHKHASASLAFEYAPLPALSLGYGPCLEFPLSSEEESGVHFIHHLELSYEFDLGFMQLGPVVEYGFRKEDKHFMLGVHTGYNF